MLPPIMALKERGISSFDGLIPISRAILRVAGSITATAAVLLIKPEDRPTISINIKRTLVSLPRPLRTSFSLMVEMTPVRTRPALRMNIAATVMVAWLLKPAMASSGVTRPNTTRAMRIPTDTRSTGTLSETNSISAAMRMPRTRAICI